MDIIKVNIDDKIRVSTPRLQDIRVEPSRKEQTVCCEPPYDGFANVTVAPVTKDVDKNIMPQNIKKDVFIMGVRGTCSAGGSGFPIEVESEEKMESLKVIENENKIFKYLGETTDNYTNKRSYLLIKDGGNIGIPDPDMPLDLHACKLYDYPLEVPFVNGDKVKINFTIDGSVEQAIESTYFVDERTGRALLAQPEYDGFNMLYMDDNIMIGLMAYLNWNPVAADEVGQLYGVVWEGNEEIYDETYCPYVEILSFENERGTVINPLQVFYRPMVEMKPLQEPATAQDIFYRKQAYDQNGNIIEGTMTNPVMVSSEEELLSVLEKSNTWQQPVCYLNTDTENYISGYYTGTWDYDLDKYVPTRMTVLEKIEPEATSDHILWGRYAYNSNGEYMYGTLNGIYKVETAEEMDLMVEEGRTGYICKYVGETTKDYVKDAVYILRKNGTDYYNMIYFWEQLVTMSTALGLIGGSVDTAKHIRLGGDKYGRTPMIELGRFSGNYSIETIEFMNDNERIGIDYHAFYGCMNLKTIIIRSKTAPQNHYIHPSAFEDASSEIQAIYVQDNLVETYKSLSEWALVADIIKPLSEYVEEE